MKQSLADLRGGTLMRIANPRSVDLAALDIEINHSVEELAAKVKDLREAWLDTFAYDNIKAGEDIYPLPPDCAVLKDIVRFDIELGSPVPLKRQDTDKWWEADALSFASGFYQYPYGNPYLYTHITDNRIFLFPKPTTDYEDGLRYMYQKRVTPLVNASDVPPFAEELHEWIVVAAVDRMRQYNNVQLAHPEEFERFRTEQTQRLMRYLRPKETDEAPEWGDLDEFYT